MKIIIKVKKLKKIINRMNSVINDFDPISENTGIYIESFENKIIFKGRNKNLVIKYELEIENNQIGSFLIKSKTFNEAINKLEDEYVQITKNKNKSINLKTENINFTLNLLNGNFNYFPKELNSFKEVLVINGEELKRQLKSILFCASDKNSRIILRSINFNISGKKLTMIASDETKIGFSKSMLERSEKEEEFSISLPEIRDIIKLLDTSEVRFLKKENELILVENDNQIELNILENSYPNVLKFIPKEFAYFVRIKKDDLIKVFNQAMLINSIKSIDETPVKFSIIKGKLVLETKDEGIGNAVVKTGHIVTNIEEDFNIMFNPKFIVETLKTIEENEIELLFNTYEEPFLVGGKDIKEHQILILPFGNL